MNRGTRKGVVAMLVLAAIMGISGCSNAVSANSKIEQGPVGIGRSINELKGTPCACAEIPMLMPESMKV